MDLKQKKIDKYIIKKFILTFFIALLLIIGIVILFDISEKINKFVENKAPLKAVIFDYYVNFIPYFMNMFSPLFVFITVIFFTSRMAANSEIIAILSCGVSYKRMLRPYMISAALIAILSLGLSLWVIPRSNVQRVQFETRYVKKKNPFSSNNVHYQIDPGKFVYVESFSTWNNTAYDFTGTAPSAAGGSRNISSGNTAKEVCRTGCGPASSWTPCSTSRLLISTETRRRWKPCLSVS